jgi:hypothetical protein
MERLARHRAAGFAGALFEEGRGRGAAGIGLSTGFLRAADGVKTLHYRRAGGASMRRSAWIFLHDGAEPSAHLRLMGK